MTWKFHDNDRQEWGEVTIRPRFDEHERKYASDLQYGHVKIDNDTITLDVDGKIKVRDDIAQGNTITLPINISDVLNLQTDLDDKASITHSHNISEVNGLQLILDDKANLVHTHVSADITDFQMSVETIVNGMNLVVPTASLTVEGKVILSNDINSQDQTKASTPKAVNDALIEAKNYTDSELAGFGGLFAPVNHTHQLADIIGLVNALNGKANTSHLHNTNDIINFAIEVNNIINTNVDLVRKSDTVVDVQGLLGIRVVNNKLEFYDTTTSSWKLVEPSGVTEWQNF